jgi:hypothetical protein
VKNNVVEVASIKNRSAMETTVIKEDERSLDIESSLFALI